MLSLTLFMKFQQSPLIVYPNGPPPTVHVDHCGVPQVHDGEEFNTVAAGEDIGIGVTFRNPLQIKLALSRVRLHLQFTPADKATPGAEAPAASAAAGAGGGDAVSPEDVLVMESQFSLHPG
jgi:hypothetical protein